MWRYLVLVVAILIAAALSSWASIADRLPGDGSISVWFQGIRSGWLEETMEVSSAFGRTVPLLLLLASLGLLLYLRGRRLHLLALAMAGAGTGLAPILKELIGRPRPAAESITVHFAAGGYSFPSGHAFSATLMLGIVFYLAKDLCGPHPWAVRGLRAAIALLILLIGASRVYLGAHWSSDVLGGYLLGGLTLAAVIWAFKALAPKLTRRTP